GVTNAAPWRCLCRRSSRKEWAPAHSSTLAAESVVHPDPHFAPERRVPQRVLILLVEEVLYSHIRVDAAAQIVSSRDVKSTVPGSTGQPETQKVRIGAVARKVSSEIAADSPPCGKQHN